MIFNGHFWPDIYHIYFLMFFKNLEEVKYFVF